MTEKAREDDGLVLQLDDFQEESADYGVVIAGEFYAYANVDSWGLIAKNRFAALQKSVQALESKANATERDEAEYEKKTREAIKMIVPTLSDDVLLRMKSPAKRSTLMMDFFLKLGQNHPLMTLMRQVQRQIGEKSSPVSIGSGRSRTRKSG